MKKKIGKVVCSLLLVFLGVMIGITLGIDHAENSNMSTVQTYKDIQGLTYEYVVGDIKRGATILKCSPSSKEVEIPENIICDEEVYQVKSIDLDDAFTNYSVLENIYVAQGNSYFSSVDGVLFNKDGAILFTYPKGRDETSYVVPDTVNVIEYKAFENCSNLTNIEIPRSVRRIGYRALANCGNLKSIELPDLLAEIDEQAFAECMNLENFNIPSSVESMAANTFINTKWYKNQKDGIVYLDNWLIGYKGNMELDANIVISDKVEKIAMNVFSDHETLKSVTIPNSVKTIPSYMFSGCENLIKVAIPNSVTSIGISAFMNCVSLEELVIPESVKVIEDSAFDICVSLKSLSIPKSVESIGEDVFFACENLKEVSVVSGSYAEQYMKDNYPNIELIVVEK